MAGFIPLPDEEPEAMQSPVSPPAAPPKKKAPVANEGFIPLEEEKAPRSIVAEAVKNAPPATTTASTPQQPRSYLQANVDAFKRSANRGLSGFLARNFMAATGYNTPEEMADLPYAERKRLIEKASQQIDQQFAEIEQSDPDLFKQITADLVGGSLASAIPVAGVLTKGSLLSRLGQAAGWGVAADTVEQGLDIGGGLQEGYDVTRGATAAAGGAAFEGAFSGLAKVFGRNRVELAEDGTPVVRQENPDGSTTIYTDPESGVTIRPDGTSETFGSNTRAGRFGEAPTLEELGDAEFGPNAGPVDTVDPNQKVTYGMMTPEEEQAFAEASFAVRDRMYGIADPNMNEADFLQEVGQELAARGLDPNIVKKTPFIPGQEATSGVTPRLIEDSPTTPQETYGNVEPTKPLSADSEAALAKWQEAEDAVKAYEDSFSNVWTSDEEGELWFRGQNKVYDDKYRAEAAYHRSRGDEAQAVTAEQNIQNRTLDEQLRVNGEKNKNANDNYGDPVDVDWDDPDSEDQLDSLLNTSSSGAFGQRSVQEIPPYDPVVRNNPTPLPANANGTEPKTFEEAAASFEAARAAWVDKNGNPADKIKARRAQASGAEPPGGGGGGFSDPPGPVDPKSVMKKMANLARQARILNKKKSTQIAEERSRRAKELARLQKTKSGIEGLNAELAALRGPMSDVDFDPIQNQFTQSEIDSLFKVINEATNFLPYQKTNVKNSLRGILEGRVPTSGELDLMARFIDKDLLKAITEKAKGKKRTLTDIAGNVLNLPRAVMASYDLSAPLRQGVMLVGTKQWWSSLAPMVKAAMSKEYHKGLMDDIYSRPTYDLMDQAGLYLAEMGQTLSAREEAFGSRLAQKIPGIGASERGYTAFLNKLRADTFDSLASAAQRQGVDFEANPEALKAIARFVNNATGRGDLPAMLESSAPVLNALLFSPRLLAARVNMLTNPTIYARLPKGAREEMAKSLLRAGAIGATVISMAQMAGADVEADPRSTNFGKIRIKEGDNDTIEALKTLPGYFGVGVQTYDGENRFDILGGYGQIIRAMTQFALEEKKNRKGEIVEGDPDDFFSPNRGKILLDFLRTKASPLAGYAINAMVGENIIGEKFDPMRDTINLFIPLSPGATFEAALGQDDEPEEPTFIPLQEGQ